MSEIEIHSRLVRVHPSSGWLWDNLRNLVERIDVDTLKSLGLSQRTYRGRVTDSALLDFAVDTALASLDPDHVKRNPMPGEQVDGLSAATFDELIDELLTLELRMREVRDRLADLWSERTTGNTD